MEVYFYCSYAHSMSGFTLARLSGQALEQAGRADLPEKADDFFSAARFRFLWQELAEPVHRPWQRPKRTGAFLGLRELHGTLADGRSCAMNLVITADSTEIALLRRVALHILGDYAAFARQLAAWMAPGSPCSYTIDGAAFRRWLEACGKHTQLHRLCPADSLPGQLLHRLQESEVPRLEVQLLRLAVCTDPWDRIQEYFGNGWMWRKQPAAVVSVAEFDAAFQGKLWEFL